MTTGQQLVLCDGDARAFRAAYAQYLVTCSREFANGGTHLPTALQRPYARLVELVRVQRAARPLCNRACWRATA